MTTVELIRAFRLTVPLFSDVTDEELTSDIEAYSDYVSEKTFGKLYPKALAFFVAHMRILQQSLIHSSEVNGSLLVDLHDGVIVREKEGDLELQYDVSAIDNSSSGVANELLKKTLYGKLFLQLRAMVLVPATVRAGKRRCAL